MSQPSRGASSGFFATGISSTAKRNGCPQTHGSREGGFSMMTASHGDAVKLKPACFGLRPCSFAPSGLHASGMTEACRPV